MSRLIFFLFLTMAAIITQPVKAHPAYAKLDVRFYNTWASLPSAELMRKANYYLHNQKCQDSALVCYTVVANRYYRDGLSADDKRMSITAMNNAGYLFYAYYNDYDKAYTTLRQALDMAVNEKDVANQVLINLNLANIKSIYLDVQSNNLSLARQTLTLYRKAFYQAIEIKKWPWVVGILSNMLDESFINKSTLAGTLKHDIAVFRRLSIPSSTPLLGYVRSLISCYEALQRHNYAKALQATYDMQRLNNSPDTPERFLVVSLSLRSNILHRMGRDAEAALVEQEAIKVCQSKHINDKLVRLYASLYQYYRNHGNASRAQQYRIAYLELKEAIMSENKLQNVSRLDFLYQLREVNNEVERLSAQHHWQNIVTGIIVGFAIIVNVLLVVLFVNYRKVKAMNRVLYNNVQNSLRQEREKQHSKQPQSAEKYKNSRLTELDKDELARRIETVMDNTDEICNADFSLYRLAELVGISYKDASQVINERYGKNFKALLNEYRIHEACRRLTDETEYGHLTIEGVAASVGIKSRSHFNTYFKQVTGLSPSVYQKLSKERPET